MGSVGVLSLLVGSRAEALNISAILKYGKSEITILDCSIPGEYSKISILFFKRNQDRLLNGGIFC